MKVSDASSPLVNTSNRPQLPTMRLPSFYNLNVIVFLFISFFTIFLIIPFLDLPAFPSLKPPRLQKNRTVTFRQQPFTENINRSSWEDDPYLKPFESPLHICYNLKPAQCYHKAAKVIYKHLTWGNSTEFSVSDDNVLMVRNNTVTGERGRNGTVGSERIVPDWEVGLKEALTQSLTDKGVYLNVVQGFHFNGKVLEQYGYEDVTNYIDVDKHRLGEVVLTPRDRCEKDERKTWKLYPWLAQFRNVFVMTFGQVVVPVRKINATFYDARIYDMGGGCCLKHWIPYRGKFLHLARQTVVEKQMFMTGQYHGSSFHHVMVEQVPRHLAFWRLLNRVKDLKIMVFGKIINGKTVLENMLETLGWPEEKVVQYSFGEDDIRAVEKVYMPSPEWQDRRHYSLCKDMVIGQIFTEMVNNPKRLEGTKQKPVILVIERASKRRMGENAQCWGNRCTRNLPQLVNTLREKFGGAFEVRVMKQSRGNFLMQGISEFQNAHIVIGAHGAGFQNMMFMKNGSHAIHFGWEEMWGLYANLAKKHGVSFQNVLTNGIKGMSRNFDVDIQKTVETLRRIINTNPP